MGDYWRYLPGLVITVDAVLMRSEVLLRVACSSNHRIRGRKSQGSDGFKELKPLVVRKLIPLPKSGMFLHGRVSQEFVCCWGQSSHQGRVAGEMLSALRAPASLWMRQQAEETVASAGDSIPKRLLPTRSGRLGSAG